MSSFKVFIKGFLPSYHPPAANVILHWLVVITLLVSFVTGLRIASDASDTAWMNSLDSFLPQGQVFFWHLLSANLLVAILLAYSVYLVRTSMVGKFSIRRRLTQLHSAKGLWRLIDTISYWVLLLLTALVFITGSLNYLLPAMFSVVPFETIHNLLSWGFALYLLIHIVFHLIIGGMGRMTAMFSPSRRYLFPGAGALAILVVSSVAVSFIDSKVHSTLQVAKVETPPTIDGHIDDATWASAKSVRIRTTNGANFPDGESLVDVRAVHDGHSLYLRLKWSDPTCSQKHLPLIKTEEGWKVLQTDYLRHNENRFYEDKFAVLLASKNPYAAVESVHLGQQPLAGQPGSNNGRGLHYTTNDQVLDLWHWKSVRNSVHGQADDNYLGAPHKAPPQTPRAFEVGRKDNYRRFTAGYKKDPPTSWSGYSMNWEMFGEGIIKPRRLPIDPDDLYELKLANTSRELSDDGQWWMEWNDTKPYFVEQDDYEVGTILPGVLTKTPLSGDRGDVEAYGHWQDGHWQLEMKRALETDSPYDVAIKDNVLMWFAAFNHSQIEHTRHLKPVRLTLQ